MSFHYEIERVVDGEPVYMECQIEGDWEPLGDWWPHKAIALDGTEITLSPKEQQDISDWYYQHHYAKDCYHDEMARAEARAGCGWTPN